MIDALFILKKSISGKLDYKCVPNLCPILVFWDPILHSEIEEHYAGDSSVYTLQGEMINLCIIHFKQKETDLLFINQHLLFPRYKNGQ